MADQTSLADAFRAVTASTEVTTDPIVAPVTDNGEPAFVVDTNPAEEVVTTDTTVDTIDNTEGYEGDEDVLKTFAKGIGYDKDIAGSSVDDLINAVNEVYSPLKEKVAVLETNPILKDLLPFVQAGGNPADFFAQPQETNYYQDIEALEADDIENREEVYRIYYSSKGLSEEEIDGIMSVAKDKGKFNADSDKIFNALKADELASNTQLHTAREQEIKEGQEKAKAFFANVETAFTSGLAGVTVDSTLLQEAKAASLPDATGKIGLQEIFSKLTPAQEATINTLVLAITKGKSFQYNPTKGAVTRTNKPIHSVITKSQGIGDKGTEVKSLSGLNKLFAERKN